MRQSDHEYEERSFGDPVVLNFAKEPNPGVFERVRDILLATSYTKKTS